MAGLIAQAIDSKNADNVYGAPVTSVNATTRQVDPAKETVAGQLDALLKKGNPYIDAARSGAAETANKRGLLNSSMAAGAGEASAIAAATPIATADAGTFSTASQQNQAYQNQAGLANAAAANTSDRASADSANTMVQQQVKGTQAVQLANIEAQYKQLMQTSASASAYFSTAAKNINDILSDVNTSAEQKQAAVDAQSNFLVQSLRVIGAISNVDIAGLLSF